jgi:hypothetical protein
MPPLTFPLLQPLPRSTHSRELCLAPPSCTCTPGQARAEAFGGHPVPQFGPPKDALVYCYMGGGVAYQPPQVSAVVCRARSEKAAVSLLLAAQLLSLRGPSPTAMAVTPRGIKAEESDSPPLACERERIFLQALRSAAQKLDLPTSSKARGNWTCQQANAKIAELLAAGFVGGIVPASGAAAPTASSSSGQ